MLKALIGSVDMHSIHFYTMLGHEKHKETVGFEYENNVFGPAVRLQSGYADHRLPNIVYACAKPPSIG